MTNQVWKYDLFTIKKRTMMLKKYSGWLATAWIIPAVLALSTENTAAQTCTPRTIPYVETFDTLTAPALPPCTENVDLDGDGKAWKTQGLSSNVNLRFRDEDPNINEGWYYTEGIELDQGVTYTFRCQWLAAGRVASPAPHIKVGNSSKRARGQQNH